ncbi:MAG: DUF1697 domain-containing protein [Pirellulales bacterium]|nr:DUF1697 domain-containing protein [Pirellulales bacterium]
MPRQTRYLALLRGINVGGKNIISKDDLRQCFEGMGFSAVRTYIQSGNILFQSTQSSVAELTAAIEARLSGRFKYNAQAVVIARGRYKSAVAAAPSGWGKDEQQKHNAMFMLRGVTPKRILAQLPKLKPDIESVATGPGVIFWSASISDLTKTTMVKLAKEPVYQQMTVRNHNTVFKLLELLEDMK